MLTISVNFIFYYGTTFFSNSGIKNPFLITIATNIVNTFTTPFGMWAADHVGRRPLMLIGAAGMGIAQLIVAITGTAISSDNEAGQKVLVAFVMIFIAFFATTWATLAWVLTSEIYPYQIRAKGMSLSTATQWLFNFAIGYATPYLVDPGAGNANLGSKVFFIWGGCCMLATVFAFFVSFRLAVKLLCAFTMLIAVRSRDQAALIGASRHPVPQFNYPRFRCFPQGDSRTRCAAR